MTRARSSGEAQAPQGAYTELPPGWRRVSSRGPGPFVTGELLRSPEGTEVRWESRSHRKGSGASPHPERHRHVWWRPDRRNWWMAVLFAVGSTCFAAGGIAAQWTSSSPSAIGVVFFVGSLFFTTAAYLQYAEAVNVERSVAAPRSRRRWRPASWEPRRIDWLAALVQFIGTLLFNVSTFAALNTSLSTHQYDARVWSPDVFGCTAFLISSELAFAEVCHRWLCFRGRGLSWKIVAFNLLGSIAFGVSAVAALAEPSSGQPVSVRIANGGTSFGGVCFLIGALLLMPEAATAEQETRERRALPAGAAQATV